LPPRPLKLHQSEVNYLPLALSNGLKMKKNGALAKEILWLKPYEFDLYFIVRQLKLTAIG